MTKTIITNVNRFVAVVSGFLIFLISLFATYEAVSRSLFNEPTKWTSSISVVMMLFGIFLASPYCFQEEGHIRIELILDKLKNNYYKIVNLFSYLLCLVTVVIMGWESINFTIRSFKFKWLTLTTIEFPLGYVSLIIPLGCLLMVLAIYMVIVKQLKKKAEV